MSRDANMYNSENNSKEITELKKRMNHLEFKMLMLKEELDRLQRVINNSKKEVNE